MVTIILDMFAEDKNGYFEILIYVVAMVIGLVANAYRNYAKRKQREMNPEPTQEPDFPDVLFEPVEEPEIHIPEPMITEQEVELPEPVTERKEEKAEEVNDIPEASEGKAAFQTTSEQLVSDDIGNVPEEESILSSYRPISESEVKSPEDEPEVEEEIFNLEQAVIYSEILKPKYFDNSY
jgi:hypothetical protein